MTCGTVLASFCLTSIKTPRLPSACFFKRRLAMATRSWPSVIPSRPFMGGEQRVSVTSKTSLSTFPWSLRRVRDHRRFTPSRRTGALDRAFSKSRITQPGHCARSIRGSSRSPRVNWPRVRATSRALCSKRSATRSTGSFIRLRPRTAGECHGGPSPCLVQSTPISSRWIEHFVRGQSPPSTLGRPPFWRSRRSSSCARCSNSSTSPLPIRPSFASPRGRDGVLVRATSLR